MYQEAVLHNHNFYAGIWSGEWYSEQKETVS